MDELDGVIEDLEIFVRRGRGWPIHSVSDATLKSWLATLRAMREAAKIVVANTTTEGLRVFGDFDALCPLTDHRFLLIPLTPEGERD